MNEYLFGCPHGDPRIHPPPRAKTTTLVAFVRESKIAMPPSSSTREPLGGRGGETRTVGAKVSRPHPGQ